MYNKENKGKSFAFFLFFCKVLFGLKKEKRFLKIPRVEFLFFLLVLGRYRKMVICVSLILLLQCFSRKGEESK